jgi:hypothetical protein
MNDPRLVKIEKLVESLVQTGNDTRSIRLQLVELFDSEVLIDLAIANYRSRRDHVYDLEDPYVITSDGKKSERSRWYAGPTENSVYWNFVKTRLEHEGRSKIEIEEVLDSSSTILGLLDPPASQVAFSSRGLVLGYVQSGKTTNFIATAAQAADTGYRLIVVLSGVTNNLRKQTQDRLERSLTGTNPNNWHWLTSLDADFNESKNANQLLSPPGNRVIAVIKKNNSRLKSLKKWLNSAPLLTRQGLPVLFIDDEADQATINSAKVAHRQTAINKTLTEILDTKFLPRHAYLGYTATPFANILSDARTEQQLFPRDFIYPLKRPENYFGAEQLFGRNPLAEEEQEISQGRNIVISVSFKDRSQLGKLANTNSVVTEPTLPNSLLEAIKWFIVSTAARRYRSKKNKFSTMLIHTSGRIYAHQDMKTLVEKQLNSWKKLPPNEISRLFEDCWDSEKSRGTIDGDEQLPKFIEIESLVSKVLDELKLIVDNSRSDDRLVYDFENEEESVPFIVIGGNTLARGLTLEGLICSYFMRTSSYYDSLLQMGRWFGYRVGYDDLQRIWMQDDLIPMFRDLALVEEEVRSQITELAKEGRQPIQVPILIRDHPIMGITAPNKMNYAKKLRIGYAEKRTETITFSSNPEWLQHNLNATKNFVTTLSSRGLIGQNKSDQGFDMAQEVPWDLVKEYVLSYNFLETARIANGELISKYVDLHQGKGELEKWNIFFYKTLHSTKPSVDFGHGIEISPINRSAKDIDPLTGAFNIHHLVSSVDGAADVPLGRRELQQRYSSQLSDSGMRIARKDFGLQKTGLLGIYLVDKNSEAMAKDRIPLNVDNHIVGLGFFFPKSSLDIGVVDYYGPDLPDENIFEDDYLEDADNQDEVAQVE